MVRGIPSNPTNPPRSTAKPASSKVPLERAASDAAGKTAAKIVDPAGVEVSRRALVSIDQSKAAPAELRAGKGGVRLGGSSRGAARAAPQTAGRASQGTPSLVAIQAEAKTIVDAVAAGEGRAALALAYGAKASPQHARLLEAAIDKQVRDRRSGRGPDLLAARLSRSEQIMLRAYLRNPSGKLEYHDRLCLAMLGAGTGEKQVADVYHSIVANSATAEEAEAVLQQTRERFSVLYGHENFGGVLAANNRGGVPVSLDELVTKGELSGDAAAEVRAARVGASDALALYQALEVGLGTDEEGVFAALERGLGRRLEREGEIERDDLVYLAQVYDWVAHGKRPVGDALPELQRTEMVKDLRGALASVWASDGANADQQRLEALLRADTVDYLRHTLVAFEHGDASERAVLGAFARLAGSEKLTYAALKTAIAKDPQHRRLLDRLRAEPHSAVGQLLTLLDHEGGAPSGEMQARAQMRALCAGPTAGLEPKQWAIQTARFVQANAGTVGFADMLEAREAISSILAQNTSWKGDGALRGARDRLVEALDYRTNAASLLAAVEAQAAEGYEAVIAIGQMPAAERARFAADYDTRFGAHAFAHAVGNLSKADRLGIELQIATAALTDPAHQERARARVVELVDEARGHFISEKIMDGVGFTGVVVDDAMFELLDRAKVAGGDGMVTEAEQRGVDVAALDLMLKLRDYYGEQRDVRDAIAWGMLAVTLPVGGWAMGATAGLTRFGVAVGIGAMETGLPHAVLVGSEGLAGEVLLGGAAGGAVVAGGPAFRALRSLR